MEVMTIKKSTEDHYTAKELREILKEFDPDTPIYIPSKKGVELCRFVSYEIDGTITLLSRDN